MVAMTGPVLALALTAASADLPPVQPALPERFANVEAGALEHVPSEKWWREFGDPALDRLVESAIGGSFDIAEAEARLRRARAGVQAARGASLPAVAANGNAAAARLSIEDPQLGAASRFPGFYRNQDRYAIGLGASWEIDLFGRLDARTKEARADAASAAQGVGAARLAVASEIAERYVLLRLLQQRRIIALRRADVLAELERLSALRVARGVSPEVERDRLAAEARVAASVTPALDAGIEDQFARIDVLAGRKVGTARRELAEPTWTVVSYTVDFAATPAILLTRRPDVVAAQSELAARNFRVAAAERDRLPRFNLAALFATVAGAINPLFGSAAATAQGSGGLGYTLFDGGRSRAAVEAARADVAGGSARYQRSVLSAIADVESAASAQRSASMRAVSAAEAQARLEKATASIRLAQAQGAASLSDLLDVDRRLQDAREARLLAQADYAIASVALVRALGGGV